MSTPPTAAAAPVRRGPAFIPIMRWLPHYRRTWLRGDVLAGLAVASVAIPTAMGYSTVADVPVQVGLYALPAALILYAIFGSSRQVSVGPTSTVAIMSGAVVFGVVGSGDPVRATAVSAAVAISAGLLLTLAGALRLGWITDFISRPVITGFTIGLSIVVICGELPHLLGVPTSTTQFVPRLWETVQQIPDASLETMVIGALSLVVVFGGPRLLPQAPWALILMIAGIIGAGWLHPAESHLEVLGAVPAGLPVPAVPAISMADVPQVVLGGLAVAIAGVGEGLSAARVFAARGNYRVNSDQEFLGTGIANVGAGFSGGMPVTGSLSRTATAAQSGGKTQLTGVVAALCVLVVLLAFTGLLANVPRSVLSAIVIASVWPLLAFPTLHHYLKVRRNDYVAALTGLVGVLLFGPLYGLLAAVAISVIGLTFRSSRVTIDPLGKIPGEKAGWGAIVDHPDREQADGILVLRVNAPMFWANAARMHDLVLQEVDDSPGIRALVLDLEATSQLDSTSIDALHALLDQLQADDVELFIARLHYTARVVLDNSGFTDLLGEGHMWHSISQSVKAAKKSVKETRTDG